MALTPEEQAELEALEKDTELQDYLTDMSKPKKPEVETGMTEAFLRGGAQTLTFNTADEIAAALEGGLGMATGKGFSEPYEQALQESRAEYAASEEQYPKSTFAGQLAGGVAQAVGLGALAAPAAAGGGAISRIAQLGKSVLVPTTKAGLAKNVGAAALAGAAQGGLSSIGASEKEGLQRFEDVPSAVLSGAGLGAGLAGATGLAGAGIKKGGEFISKGIDEGKYPEFFKNIRSAWRSGQREVGTIASEDKRKTLSNVFDFAENEVRPKLKTTLQEVNDLKQQILSGVDIPLDISPDMKTVNSELKKIGSKAEKKLRKDVLQLYNTKIEALNASGKPMGVLEANEFASDLSNLLASDVYRDVNKNAKKLLWDFANKIKSNIRNNVTPEKALQPLLDNPQALAKFSKYAASLSQDEMFDLFMKGKNEPFNAKEALNKAKDIRDIFKVMTAAFGQEDPTVVTDLIKNPAVKQAITTVNPIEKLDDIMSKILSGSKIMGDITGTASYDQAGALEDAISIFKNIIAQSKDTEEAFLNKERFEKFMKNLEVVPDLAKDFRKKLTPLLEDLQTQRYTEGGGKFEGARDSGVIKGLIKNIGQYSATGANLASQISKTASEGKAGPIPLLPTSTLLRPATSTFQTAKQVADDVLAARPDSKVWASLSKLLGEALEEKDPNRRAAILNTLMQYESLRNIISPYKKE